MVISTDRLFIPVAIATLLTVTHRPFKITSSALYGFINNNTSLPSRVHISRICNLHEIIYTIQTPVNMLQSVHWVLDLLSPEILSPYAVSALESTCPKPFWIINCRILTNSTIRYQTYTVPFEMVTKLNFHLWVILTKSRCVLYILCNFLVFVFCLS